MKTSDKLSIVMFTGGRGTHTIATTLLKYPYVTLTLLVNAYDDGLSTGRLRTFVPGMLGPSDVRKNVSRLIPEDDAAYRALHKLIEYRLPTPCTTQQAQQVLRAIRPETPDFPIPELKDIFSQLDLRHARILAEWTDLFLHYWQEQVKAGHSFDFGDCSLGNIFFTGCYLQCQRSFNKAVERFNEACDARGRVLNVSDGHNLVLVGLKESGSYLPDEAHIVSEQEEAPIEDLFLLPSYLEESEWKGQPKDALRKLLSSRDKIPRIDPEADQALRTADIIIYGPGTQHSSLFPSYFTQGVSEAIAANTTAEKIFIGNIQKDFEIKHETAETLVQKFLYYLNRKSTTTYSWKDLVTLFFLQDPNLDETQALNAVTFDPSRFPFPANQVVVTNWSSDSSLPTGEAGAHSGGRVLDEVIRVVNTKTQKKLRPFRYTVSIVVPGLNEAATVRNVLRELTLLDFSSLGVGKEVIYVDGGSRDESLELAKSVPDVKVFSLKDEKGRGSALRLGIQKATGDMITFFPSDGEYEVKDLFPVIQGIVKNEFNAVYGSRLIKCVDSSQRILEIYQGNYLLYLTSKFGGMLVSIMSLWFFNRFITDPFSGIKAFDARLLRSLELTSTGFEIETELLAKLGQKQQFVLEIPVDYHPRTRAQGKKTTLLDGLRAITKILALWLRPA